MNAARAPERDVRAEMVELLQGAWRARAVHVAAELGIPDLLVDGPRTVADLAARTKTHAPTLGRLLRTLTSFGVFERLADGNTYAQSALSAVLCTNPGCAEATDALFQAAPWHWAAWGELLFTVQTGTASFDRANGSGFWELTRTNPDAQRRFNSAMSSVSEEESDAIAHAYDFSGVRELVDVAGGKGSLLRAVLRANPDIRGKLLDRPSVLSLAADLLSGQGVDDRYELVPGDFFQSVPPGADVYLIKRALHDWEADDIVRILVTIRRAMRPDSRLLVIESTLEDDAKQEWLFRDLLLLVLCGGQERAEREYRELMSRAGLRVTRSIPIGDGPLRVIEAVRE
ncbi:hypothetical protein ALI144C_36645 [Actinosynnema sp. ALI-1.44]|uniref:methyltransferase n=1 Tax=Actinosynnema sp. ALI-1.44 TaxID=1933779 RepID=UPI00097CBC29|nr:methyltransferase [Actinosynnema sp. ALI-1.44]ONI76205.1 hypothetical protein ALI144C_36645 [Actinosynnema sp. ALI-1.44]